MSSGQDGDSIYERINTG